MASDLRTQSSTAKSGFDLAVGGWNAPNKKYFLSAYAGIRLQLTRSHGALDGAISALATYANALRTATDNIRDLQRKADQAEATSGSVHALQQEADAELATVRRSARITTGLLNALTDGAVTGASKLSAEQIARKVTSRDGVAGLDRAWVTGSMTTQQAWDAMKAPGTEIPINAINEDGSINDKKFLLDTVAAAKGRYPPVEETIGGDLRRDAKPTWGLRGIVAEMRAVHAVRERYFPPKPAHGSDESVWEWTKKHPWTATVLAVVGGGLLLSGAGEMIDGELFGTVAEGSTLARTSTALSTTATTIGGAAAALDYWNCLKGDKWACAGAATGGAGSAFGAAPRLIELLVGSSVPVRQVVRLESTGLGLGAISWLIDANNATSTSKGH